MLTFPNGSDHAMIACYYLKKVKSSISMMFGPIPNIYSLVVYIHVMRTRNSMRMHKKIPVNTQLRDYTSTFEGKPLLLGWVGGTIDMSNFTLFIEFKIACNNCMA